LAGTALTGVLHDGLLEVPVELERMGLLHGQKFGREVYFIHRALFEQLMR
jgi:hypothetical protein